MLTILLSAHAQPVTRISAAAVVVAFLIWGVLVGIAGAALTWVLKGDRFAEDEHEPRPFKPGQIGVATSDINDTTVIIPLQRRRPPRLDAELTELALGDTTGVTRHRHISVSDPDRDGATVRLPRQRSAR